MKNQIARELNIHGESWDNLHGGYFSDPDIAAPLLNKVRELIQETSPEMIVDLGGGTGYLLSQLDADQNIRMITTGGQKPVDSKFAINP